jgi:hypothetical protein
LDAVGCSFALLKRVCWPALEECYVPTCVRPAFSIKVRAALETPTGCKSMFSQPFDWLLYFFLSYLFYVSFLGSVFKNEISEVSCPESDPKKILNHIIN